MRLTTVRAWSSTTTSLPFSVDTKIIPVPLATARGTALEAISAVAVATNVRRVNII